MRIVLLLIATLVFTEVGAQKAIIKGSITGMADEPGWLIIDRFDLGVLDTIEFRPNGSSFQIELDLAFGARAELIYKDKSLDLYCLPEKTTSLNFEADFLNSTATFNGELAGINTFFKDLTPALKEKTFKAWLEGQAGSATNLDGLEMDLFRDRSEMVKEARSNGISEPELKMLKQHFGFYYYLGLHRFSSLRSAQSDIPKATEIPDVLLEGLTSEIMNRPTEMWGDFYRQLLLEWVSYGTLKEYDMMKFGDAVGQFNAEFSFAKENLEGPNVNYSLAKNILRHRDALMPSDLRRTVAELERNDPHPQLLKQLKQLLGPKLTAEDAKTEVVQTKRPKKYNLTLRDEQGNEFSLDDLKGKVVYLDIWASWCGPCRKQFPFAKRMKNDLSKKEKKQVVFLYISIDNTETAWKKAIEQYDLDGMHGFSPGGWGSDVTKIFKVNSIPRYLLFDKKGELVDHNATRPADPATLEKIRNLMRN